MSAKNSVSLSRSLLAKFALLAVGVSVSLLVATSSASPLTSVFHSNDQLLGNSLVAASCLTLAIAMADSTSKTLNRTGGR